MDKSKINPERVYIPSSDSVEARPNVLYVGHERPLPMLQPHWHAQVEVNYMVRGNMDYRIGQQVFRLQKGELVVFWGGITHQGLSSSEDADYVCAHLPLMDFFRLRLLPDIQSQLMQGSILICALHDPADVLNFVRWADYLRFGNEAKVENALDELLLRLERTQFGNYQLLGPSEPMSIEYHWRESTSHLQLHIARICSFVGANFREEITVTDIADAANLHPKYAMNVFKRSTGMTLNKYVSLLRLSYAQAMLTKDEINVIDVAMDCGFGSLSAFNKSFQKLAGKSPTTFRRDSHSRLGIVGERSRDSGRH